MCNIKTTKPLKLWAGGKSFRPSSSYPSTLIPSRTFFPATFCLLYPNPQVPILAKPFIRLKVPFIKFRDSAPPTPKATPNSFHSARSEPRGPMQPQYPLPSRPPMRFSRRNAFPARDARRAGLSPAAASRGPRRGAAAAGAWCRLARRLRSCAPSPASRASPLRGAGLRTPGTPRGAFLPESERSAAPRGPGGRAGKGKGEGGLAGGASGDPLAALLGGGLKKSVWGRSRPARCVGLQGRPGLRRSGVGVRAGGARGVEAAARALWCPVPARGCSSDSVPPCSCPAELSAPRSPGRPGAFTAPAPAQQRAGRVARLGQPPCPLTRSRFTGEVGAGEGGCLPARMQERAPGEHPRSLEGRQQQGSGRGEGGSEQERLMWGGGAGARDAPGKRPTPPQRLAPELQQRGAKWRGWKDFWKWEIVGTERHPEAGWRQSLEKPS